MGAMAAIVFLRQDCSVKKIAAHLEDGNLLGPEFISEGDEKVISGMSFVTARPMMVVANTRLLVAGVQH